MPADKILFLVRSRKHDFTASAVKVECLTTNPKIARIAATFVCSEDKDGELAEVWVTQHPNGERCGGIDTFRNRLNEVYNARRTGSRNDPKNPLRWEDKFFHGFQTNVPLEMVAETDIRASSGMFRVIVYVDSRPYRLADDVETPEELETLLSYATVYGRFFAVNDEGETVDARTGLPINALPAFVSSR
ncbi:MAG: hypothetical protein HZA81_02475 [Candidatus Taylorbacteria bacterium]|nr:hypothetical protein [Candidatus Taylorbacteria bacterium]